MPRTTRRRTLGVDPERAWALAADPGKLPRWWPGVDRVDRPSAERFTKWLVSPRGRAVAMSFDLDSIDDGTRVRWRQVLDGTPFAKSLRSAAEEITVEESGEGAIVSLTIERRMKGTARLGAPLIARGQRRELEQALDGLEAKLDG